MAQKYGTIHRGTCIEFGAVRGGSDLSFGPTVRNGFNVSFAGDDRVVKSGLSTLPVDQLPTDDDVQITATMLGGDLVLVREMLGIIAGVTGDLSGGSAEELIINFNGRVRQREDQIYALVEGPKGTTSPRRFDFYRCKTMAGGALDHNAEQEMNIVLKYRLLQPVSGNAMKIRDLP